jgi:putative transposase
MDGRGRFLDNIFIERLWRSIKYEEIHLKAYANGREGDVPVIVEIGGAALLTLSL